MWFALRPTEPPSTVYSARAAHHTLILPPARVDDIVHNNPCNHAHMSLMPNNTVLLVISIPTDTGVCMALATPHIFAMNSFLTEIAIGFDITGNRAISGMDSHRPCLRYTMCGAGPTARLHPHRCHSFLVRKGACMMHGNLQRAVAVSNQFGTRHPGDRQACWIRRGEGGGDSTWLDLPFGTARTRVPGYNVSRSIRRHHVATHGNR